MKLRCVIRTNKAGDTYIDWHEKDVRRPEAKSLSAYIVAALRFAGEMGGVEAGYEAMRQLVLTVRAEAERMAATQAKDPHTSETGPASSEPSLILSPLSQPEGLIVPGYE